MSSGKSSIKQLSWQFAHYCKLPTDIKRSIASLRIRGDEKHESWVARAIRAYPNATKVVFAQVGNEIVSTILMTEIKDVNLVSIYTKRKYRSCGIMTSLLKNEMIASYIQNLKSPVGYRDCQQFFHKNGINISEIKSFPK